MDNVVKKASGRGEGRGKKTSINTSYKHKMSIISLVDQIKTEKVKNSKRLKRLKGQKRLEV